MQIKKKKTNNPRERKNHGDGKINLKKKKRRNKL